MFAMLDRFRDLLNELSFRWRSTAKRRIPGLAWDPTPRTELFGAPEDPEAAKATAARLLESYRLELDMARSEAERLDILAVAELVDALLDQAAIDLPNPADILEIGPAGWGYVAGVHGVLSRHGAKRDIHLTGLELDPYVPSGGYPSRLAQAGAAIRRLPGCRYLIGDGATHHGAYDLVLILFPLILSEDALSWGLPTRVFDPGALLTNAYSLVRPGGALAVASFAYEETEIRLLLADAGIGYRLEAYKSALRCDLEGRILVTASKP